MKREEPTHLQCHPMAHETFRKQLLDPLSLYLNPNGPLESNRINVRRDLHIKLWHGLH